MADTDRLRAALLVMLMTPATRAWLDEHDPMAVRQAKIAILERGTLVTVQPGTYRTGRSLNFNLTLDRPARGRVQVVFDRDQYRFRPEVLVYLDAADLPNESAPGTVRVPLTNVEVR
jgi:hypothetical protein